MTPNISPKELRMKEEEQFVKDYTQNQWDDQFAYSDFLKQHSKSWHQLWYTIIASMPTLCYGMFSAWFLTFINIKTPEYDQDETINAIHTKYKTFTQLYITSQVFGPLALTYFINNFGRKWTIVAMCIPFLISSLLLQFWFGYYQLMFSCTIGSMATMFSLSITSAYVGEIASPHLRGSLGTLIVLIHYVGETIGFVLGRSFSINVASKVMFIGIVFSFLGCLFLPQSCYYELQKKHFAKTKLALMKIYDSTASEIECLRLQNSVKQVCTEKLKTSLKMILINGKYRRLFLIVINLYVVAHIGNAPIVLYSQKFLNEGNYKYLSASFCSVTSTPTLILGLFISIVLARLFNRKVLYQISVFGNAFFVIILMIYFFLKKLESDVLNYFPDILPFVPLSLNRAFRLLAILPFSYVYFREIIPVEILAGCTLVVDIIIPLLLTVSLLILEFFQLFVPFYLALGMLNVLFLISAIIALKTIPESKNKTLEDVQKEMCNY